MIKNVIITVQLLVISFGILFFLQYNKIIEQTHLVSGVGFIAIETRYIHKMYEKIDKGECAIVSETMKKTERNNLNDMEKYISKIDFSSYSGSKALKTAQEYAAMLHEVGIHEISQSIETRAKRLEESKY